MATEDQVNAARAALLSQKLEESALALCGLGVDFQEQLIGEAIAHVIAQQGLTAPTPDLLEFAAELWRRIAVLEDQAGHA
jgi:hypothetical protein